MDMIVNRQYCRRWVPGWLMVLVMLAPWPVFAELYRYKNDQGVTVLGNRVPPELARNGYTVLSSKGKVLEVVPRQLSEEELEAFRLEKEAEAARQQALEEQQAYDRQLLRIYSTPRDVIRVRDSKLSGVNAAVVTAEEKLKRLTERRRVMEGELANIERNGGTISAARLKAMGQLDNNISRAQAEIDKGQQEAEEVTARYAKEHARMQFLVGDNKNP